MSQNYNINMKKSNGTDYDGLLPLAYNALNSQQLDGKTFNEIQNLFDQSIANFSFFSWGTYIGSGKASSQNPNSLHFPFDPKFFYLYEIVNISSYNGAKRNKGLRA